MILLTILAFIVILGLLVFVHELGHFMVAKKSGMKVEEFGFGFPPRIFGIRRGETIYSINLIPLGGFVKIVGEDGGGHEDPRSFANKPAWQRFLVLIAGVSMNIILAWVLVSIGLGIGLPTALYEGDTLPSSAHLRNVQVGILEVQAGSPADSAGVKVGDMLQKIQNQDIATIEQAQSLTKQEVGKSTMFEIKRGSEILEKTITPRANPPPDQGPLGVALGSIGFVSYPWYEAIVRGAVATFNLIALTVTTFASLIGQLLAGHHVGQVVSGPVGIAVLTHDVTELGLIYLLQFTAVLSVNLAIINAIPFPALDGGRVLFLIIEKIRRKKMNLQTEQWANTAGFAILILLMIAVTIKDVSRYTPGIHQLIQKIF